MIGVFVLACVFPFTNTAGAIAGLCAGFTMALWLSFGAYIKQPIYPKLNVSSECYDFNTTTIQTTLFIMSIRSDKEASNLDGFDKFYSISYMWFVFIIYYF